MNAEGSPLNRRRRRRTGAIGSDDDTEVHLSPSTSSPEEAFSPRDEKGELLSAPEYLALASLSPWVPTPDAATKRLLEIADADQRGVVPVTSASGGDVDREIRHVDLGCGDGRINFAAVGEPWSVGRSTGIDVDENVLERCREKLRRRFVPKTSSWFARRRDTLAATAAGGGGGGSEDTATERGEEEETGDVKSEAERLEFLRGDLVKVVAREKERYLRSKAGHSSDSSSSALEKDPESDLVDQRLDEADIITMYFVSDALQKLRPYLASRLAAKPGVRIITVGYDVQGWEGALVWAERVLGLGVFRYDMDKLSREGELGLLWDTDNDAGNADGDAHDKYGGVETTASAPMPEEFRLGGGGDSNKLYDNSNSNHAADSDEEMAEIQRKREADFEQLRAGLRIHHDEDLDEFASVRERRRAEEHRDVLLEQGGEEWEMVDGGWDFDEEEDLGGEEAVNEEAAKRRRAGLAGTMEGRRRAQAAAGKGKEKKAGKKGCGGGKGGGGKASTPVWKKPE